MKKFVGILMTMFIIICSSSMAQLTQQQIDDQQQAIADAQQDVYNTNNVAWIITGFGCGIFGIPIAYLYEPPVPLTRLIGKSPEYVAYYTETYKQQKKMNQVQAAASGCLAWGFIYITVIHPNINSYY